LQRVQTSFRILSDLGYSVTLNPIDTPSYSLEELNRLVELTNKLNPFALTVVDTYGALTPRVMRRLLNLLHSNLRLDVPIGFHLHDNLLLASSHLYTIIEAAEVTGGRDYIVDASLVGLGRSPGNLKVELAALALSSESSRLFDMTILSEVIGRDILPIRNAFGVVYDPVYAFSAHLGVDRTFAETLSRELNLGLADSYAALLGVQRRGVRDFSNSAMDQVVTELQERK
jgi:4-hydroxy 2-oxovalerate aldolase